MPKKNIELLKRLRTRFLRMRHPEHFDMELWGNKGECGTTACIGGHALLLQGYKLKGWDTFVSPKGRTVNPFAAAQRELGLTNEEAYDLFSDNEIKTPKQAAKRIEALIE